MFNTFWNLSSFVSFEVCWYQLCGRVAGGINRKVRLGDCSLPGTGNMVEFISSQKKNIKCSETHFCHYHLPLCIWFCFKVPALSGECVLRVEGLEPNQKYVFAVAAYNSQGKLLGSTIGGTTLPLLASMPVPLLSSWAHLAKVQFQATLHLYQVDREMFGLCF